jgi:hypothetical protein
MASTSDDADAVLSRPNDRRGRRRPSRIDSILSRSFSPAASHALLPQSCPATARSDTEVRWLASHACTMSVPCRSLLRFALGAGPKAEFQHKVRSATHSSEGVFRLQDCPPISSILLPSLHHVELHPSVGVSATVESNSSLQAVILSPASTPTQRPTS